MECKATLALWMVCMKDNGCSHILTFLSKQMRYKYFPFSYLLQVCVASDSSILLSKSQMTQIKATQLFLLCVTADRHDSSPWMALASTTIRNQAERSRNIGELFTP